MGSFWEAVFKAIGRTITGTETEGSSLMMKSVPMNLPPDSCPLAPGPIALEISLDGRVLAYAVKPVCTVTGKSRNKVTFSWCVRLA